MDHSPQISSNLVEAVLARMRKQEESPWGRIQMLGHQWLNRLEGNRLIRSYHKLLRRRPSTIGMRSDPAIDVDSSFILSLLFHLLLLILLTWITLSYKPQLKQGPIRVLFLNVAKQVQRKPASPSAKRSTKPTPKPPAKVPKKKPAVVVPKPPPPLPAPKVLAESPREHKTSPAAESAEALIRLPTRQSQLKVHQETSKENLPSPTVEPVEPMAQLPTRQSSAVQTAKIEVEPAPAVTAGAISEDEISVPKELLTAEALSPPEGRPSAISHPDFSRYLDIIEKRVRSAWQYPEGISGVHKVNLVFVLDQGGQLVRVRVVKSANSKLDNSAMQAMRRASPFPPVPESLRELAGDEIRIRFTIDFGVKAAR